MKISAQFALTFACLLPCSLLWGQASPDLAKQNWHQWRGPNANGHTEGNPPTEWSSEKNIKWKLELPGEGSSTPIVWEDQVFVIGAVETDRPPAKPVEVHPEARTIPPKNIVEFFAWSVDRESGKILWETKLTEAAPHEGRHSSTTYAASSPMTDGSHLYVLLGSYGVFCLELDGSVVWQKDLGDMRTRRGWGEGVSPVVHKDRLIVNWDQEDKSSIFVLNKANGNVIWEKERDEPTTWATPLIVEQNGKTQLVTNGTTAVRSYNLEDGSIIWQSSGTTLNAIPCPVQHHDHVIVMAGYRGNLAMSVPLDQEGEVDGDSVRWALRQNTPYVPSPCLVGDRLYFTKSLAAILSCVDAKTGESLYELTRLPGMKAMYASPVAVDDRVYLTSREGKTLVIKNTDSFDVIASNDLNEDVDASLAIVGDQLFIRGKKHLYCIEAE